MKTKKLKTSAHFLSLILNIGCIIMGTLSVLLPIGIICMVCIPLFAPETFQSTWNAICSSGQARSFSQYILFFLCCSVEFTCLFFIFYNAKKIFSCIGKGHSPFTKKTAIQIRKMAIYVMSYGVISAIPIFKISFLSLLICCLFALILFCISLIFDYGCELQQEVDETL